MDVQVDLRVVELLASRLCHDLVRPIGAIGNGLELLEEAETGLDAEALQLCLKSHGRAAALLQFFRLAYGAGGRTGPRLAEARQATAAVLPAQKINLKWPAEIGDVAAPNGTGQFLMNLALLAAEALPRGGEVVIDLTPQGDAVRAAATATGAEVRVPDEAKPVLQGSADPAALTAKSVQAYFVTKLAEGFGARLQVAASSAVLRLGADLKGG
jgi:histidine phosphotransferase ChpT